MMLARYLGDGDVDEFGIPKPCHVFGLDFPVDEWVMVENPLHAGKLAANPLFETDGEAPKASKPVDRQPEPDPGETGDPDPDEVPPVDPRKPLQDALTAKGISFHHKAGLATLTKLLAENP
jgi:hypothetical protein